MTREFIPMRTCPLLILLASPFAHAADIGITETTGVGVSIGYPTGLTAKWFLDPNKGITLHTETRYYGAGVRVQYESDVAELGKDLNGTHRLHLVGGLVAEFGDHLTRAGAAGGLGWSYRLSDAPLEIYGDVQSAIFPVTQLYGVYNRTGFFDYVGAVGARWYFAPQSSS